MYRVGDKLGVDESIYTHVGVFLGNGRVFHNHWRYGAEIITIEAFCNGKEIRILSRGIHNTFEFEKRVKHLLMARKPYDFLVNNCEHAVTYVLYGAAKSPQIAFYGVACLIALGIAWSRYAA
jgi:hypothetical protein